MRVPPVNLDPGLKATWSDLPPLILELVVSHHLPDPLDINALAKTSRAMRSMMLSPALQAAWLQQLKGDIAIWAALRRCNDKAQRLSIVRHLVEVLRADVGVRMHGETALHWACGTGHDVDMVRYLSNLPHVQVNLADTANKRSPLHIACRVGHVDVVRQLLGHLGIQVNLGDQFDWTPLHWACDGGHADVVRQLLSHPDIQVNLAPQHGWTPLLFACNEGLVDAVRQLLSHPGIQVNLADQHNWTPLHLACYNGHVDAVRQLLSHPDIQANLADQHGRTPLQLATAHVHVDVAHLICSHNSGKSV